MKKRKETAADAPNYLYFGALSLSFKCLRHCGIKLLMSFSGICNLRLQDASAPFLPEVIEKYSARCKQYFA